MCAAKCLQPPGTGVRQVDADPGQQGTNLGRVAQVDAVAVRDVAQYGIVTAPPDLACLGVVCGPRAGVARDQFLGSGQIDRQPVGRELCGQELGR